MPFITHWFAPRVFRYPRARSIIDPWRIYQIGSRAGFVLIGQTCCTDVIYTSPVRAARRHKSGTNCDKKEVNQPLCVTNVQLTKCSSRVSLADGITSLVCALTKGYVYYELCIFEIFSVSKRWSIAAYLWSYQCEVQIWILYQTTQKPKMS